MGLFKTFYISAPGRPFHSKVNATSLGSFQPCRIYCTKTIRSHIHHCQCGVNEIAQFRNVSKMIQKWILVKSDVLTNHYATILLIVPLPDLVLLLDVACHLLELTATRLVDATTEIHIVCLVMAMNLSRVC